MSWEQELEKKADLINQALDRYLPPESAYPPVIHQAMRYSTMAGGKRLRGAMALASGELLGEQPERLLPLACALEMIHTYSLIHDDLPAMDNDDLRRGKPTCHKVYGEAVAILAGDALLTQAFALLPLLMELGHRSEVVIKVLAELGKAAGTEGIIGGQVVDIQSQGCRVPPETLTFMHRKKTGAMFVAAVRGGALLAGAGEPELMALTDYAESFGLAFQITDDILDLTGDESVLGKPINSDLKLEKATYPAVYGLQKAKELAAEQVSAALHNLAMFGEEAAFLREAAGFLLRRQS